MARFKEVSIRVAAPVVGSWIGLIRVALVGGSEHNPSHGFPTLL